jgi:hypothetical protein
MIATLANEPGFEVLSATTDGAMVKVPREVNFEVNEKGLVNPPPFQQLFPEVYTKLCQRPEIATLMQGKRNIGTEPDEWLEAKHSSPGRECMPSSITVWLSK